MPKVIITGRRRAAENKTKKIGITTNINVIRFEKDFIAFLMLLREKHCETGIYILNGWSITASITFFTVIILRHIIL